MTDEAAPKAPAPPAGFRKLGGEKIDGWWKPEPGSVIQGVILDRDYHESTEQFFYRVRLSEPAAGQPAGAVVGIGERSALKKLRAYAGSGKARVWICALEKVATADRQSYWRFEVAVDGPISVAAPVGPELDANRAPAGKRGKDEDGGYPF